MRILFLSGEHPRVPGRTGGIGSAVASAAAALAGAGHETHVLVCAAGLAPRDADDHGVHLHVRGLAFGAWRGQAPRLLAAAVSCRWHARRLGPFDVVESPEWQALAAGFAVARRAPLIVSLQTPGAVIAAHDPRSPHPSWAADALERLVVRRADAVLSLSRLLVDELRRTGWLPADLSVETGPPVLDADTWTTVASPATTEAIVLGIGRLEPRKGFATLLDAVATLTDVPNVRVELAGGDTSIAGGASYAGELAARARSLGVELRLHGDVPRGDLPTIVARSRVVALPSTFDSFNMAGLEAMAAGRAVVVSDRVGLGELDDGGGGLTIVPVGSVAALAAALAPFLDDPVPATIAGTAARALAARHGPQAFAAHRAACYERVQLRGSVRRRR